MRKIEMQADASVPFDETTFQLRMTEAEFDKVEAAAAEADWEPESLLAEMIHKGSVSGRIRKS